MPFCSWKSPIVSMNICCQIWMHLQLLRELETARAETLFCGHTHQTSIRELANGSIAVKVKNADSNDIQEKEMNLPMRRIVNAGSVGEPRHWRN